MTAQSEDHQYYCIELTLSKVFLKWVHSHRLLDGPIANNHWKSRPDELPFSFGGKYGTQFKTLAAIESFISAFDDLLTRKGVDAKHKYQLFYLMMFLGQDTEQQSN